MCPERAVLVPKAGDEGLGDFCAVSCQIHVLDGLVNNMLQLRSPLALLCHVSSHKSCENKLPVFKAQCTYSQFFHKRTNKESNYK